MNDQRLGDDVLHPKARVQRRERILKDDLHVAAQTTHFGRAGREQIASLEVNTARSGLDEPQNQSAERAFARAGFANQAECFAWLDVERNIVDCAYIARLLPPNGDSA